MTYPVEDPVKTETEEERALRKERKAARRAARAAAAAADLEVPAPEAGAGGGEASLEPTRKKAKREAAPEGPVSSAGGDEEARSIFLKKHRVTIEGTDADSFFPLYTFAAAAFPAQAQEALAGYTAPTPIQAAAWPILLRGRDIIGIAETGSGKTMGFALPALVHLHRSAPQRTPRALVMAPTRELALQTAAEFARLKIKQVCLYGGTPKGPQLGELRQNPDVVVATPGRLLDFVSTEECDLSQVSYAVLDEADRMLDVGFEVETRKILQRLRPERQIVMFSATWPAAVKKLAAEFLKDPVKLTIGSDELTANKRVAQTVEIIEPHRKEKRLLQLLKDFGVGKQSRVLIFVLYKKDAPYVHDLLKRQGYSVGALHGNSSQAVREWTVEQFKTGEIPIMVATDVASRGLDIDDVEHVINYSMPLTIADYIHRIGRTARAGKTGIAHSFFVPANDKNLGWYTARVLREAGQAVPPELEKYPPPAIKQEEKTCNISEVKPAPKIKFADSDDE